MIHAESVKQWEAEVRDLKLAKEAAYRAGLAEGFARGTRAAADLFQASYRDAEKVAAAEARAQVAEAALRAIVGWRQLIGSKWCYFDGAMDPREVHDSGKPCEPLCIAALAPEPEE